MKRLFALAFVLFICSTTLANEYDFVVAKDGTGDYTHVQDAIDAVPNLRKNRTTIFIKSGIYKEKLLIPSTKINISFIGEEVNTTILTYNDYADRLNAFGEKMGTSASSSVFIYGDGFEATNITFENSYGVGSQAVAVRIDGDQVKFENCRFLGNQDTLYLHGKNSRQYYKNCYIEGTVDFIFGWSTAWFERCEIFAKSKGFLTAASTEQGSAFGMVFNNCNITGDAPNSSVFLGRPWRPYAKTVFMNCKMSNIIHPDGWDPWRSEEKKETAFYAEFNNAGLGFQPENRVPWSHQLTLNEAKMYTLEKVLSDWNVNKNLPSK